MHTLQNDRLRVVVNPQGAMLWSIQDSEQREFLWQGDPRYWKGRATNLFPYIARLTEGRYTLNGQEYRMDIHGFAKDQEFETVECKDDLLVMKIQDTETTYAQYPYHFSLKISYELIDNKIQITFEVENQDDKLMYFGIGGHPGFNIPMEDGKQFEDYEAYLGDCKPTQIVFSDDVFVVGETPFELEEGGVLPLRHELFEHDAIVLKNTANEATFRCRGGKNAVKVTFPDMTYLGLWHKPYSDAPYVCIEPWTSLPSRKGIIEELSTQPGLISLKPGKIYKNSWNIEIIS